MTNYEKIKNMSVEEMAERISNIGDETSGYFCDMCPCRSIVNCAWDCEKHLQEWLESEAKNE